MNGELKEFGSKLSYPNLGNIPEFSCRDRGKQRTSLVKTADVPTDVPNTSEELLIAVGCDVRCLLLGPPETSRNIVLRCHCRFP